MYFTSLPYEPQLSQHWRSNDYSYCHLRTGDPRSNLHTPTDDWWQRVAFPLTPLGQRFRIVIRTKKWTKICLLWTPSATRGTHSKGLGTEVVPLLECTRRSMPRLIILRLRYGFPNTFLVMDIDVAIQNRAECKVLQTSEPWCWTTHKCSTLAGHYKVHWHQQNCPLVSAWVWYNNEGSPC
jgi:hypothetical protein